MPGSQRTDIDGRRDPPRPLRRARVRGSSIQRAHARLQRQDFSRYGGIVDADGRGVQFRVHREYRRNLRGRTPEEPGLQGGQLQRSVS